METSARQYVLEIYDILKQNIVVSYTGPFDGQVLTTIGNNIEYAMRDNPQAGKRMFKIFVELAQNVSYYSTEIIQSPDGHESGVGIFVIKEFTEYFVLYTGNLARQDMVKSVIQKCEMICSLDREGLREFKRQKRSLPQGDRGSGNIGLIQVALMSDGAFEYQLHPIDQNNSFFTLAVFLQK